MVSPETSLIVAPALRSDLVDPRTRLGRRQAMKRLGLTSRVPPGRKNSGGLAIPAMNRWASFACPSGTEDAARPLRRHSPATNRWEDRAALAGLAVPEGRTRLGHRLIIGYPRCPPQPSFRRPGGTYEISPAIHRWVSSAPPILPASRKDARERPGDSELPGELRPTAAGWGRGAGKG